MGNEEALFAQLEAAIAEAVDNIENDIVDTSPLVGAHGKWTIDTNVISDLILEGAAHHVKTFGDRYEAGLDAIVCPNPFGGDSNDDDLDIEFARMQFEMTDREKRVTRVSEQLTTLATFLNGTPLAHDDLNEVIEAAALARRIIHTLAGEQAMDMNTLPGVLSMIIAAVLDGALHAVETIAPE